MDRCDVAVVGGGLAGLQAARLLAAQGFSVAVVDRKARLDGPVQTTGILVRKTWEDFPLPAAAFAGGVRRVELATLKGSPAVLEAGQDEFRFARMEVLLRALSEQAQRSGARILTQTALRGIESLGQGSMLLLESAGRAWGLQAAFVIGADGARSAVARHLRLSENRAFLLGAETVYHTERDLEPVFRCFISPRLAPGYIAWYACAGGEIHVGTAGNVAEFDAPAALRELERMCARRGWLERTMVAERRGGLIPCGGILPRIAERQGLLVGDAAGAPSPLSAGGLDPCFRLSAEAAVVAARLLASGDAQVLQAYDGSRVRPRFVTRLALRRAWEWAGAARLSTLLPALARHAPFSLLARHVFFGRGSFPDGPLAAPARALHIATHPL